MLICRSDPDGYELNGLGFPFQTFNSKGELCLRKATKCD